MAKKKSKAGTNWNTIKVFAKYIAWFVALSVLAKAIFPANKSGSTDIPGWYSLLMLSIFVWRPMLARRKKQAAQREAGTRSSQQKNTNNLNVTVQMCANDTVTKIDIPSQETVDQKATVDYTVDESGLIPPEILMLSYYEKYAAGKEPAKFWKHKYSVDSVESLMRKLESMGYADGTHLTSEGKEVLKKNAYVYYVHTHNALPLSMEEMAVLVHKYPKRNYRDILWGEYNRMIQSAIAKGDIWQMRYVYYMMADHLIEEKRYKDAFGMLCLVSLYDLNEDSYRDFPSGIQTKLVKMKMLAELTLEDVRSFAEEKTESVYLPIFYFSHQECVELIIALSTGNQEIVAKSINKKHEYLAAKEDNF